MEQELDESYGGIDMKINLTRLLESSTRVQRIKQDDEDNNASAAIVITNYESASSDRAYSFELEKETFNLES